MPESLWGQSLTLEMALGFLPTARVITDGSYVVRCLVHDDKVESLQLMAGPTGKLRVRCHAGCDGTAVHRAIWALVRKQYQHQKAEAAKWTDGILRDWYVPVAPHARGQQQTRLACGGTFRLRAVVLAWMANGERLGVICTDCIPPEYRANFEARVAAAKRGPMTPLHQHERTTDDDMAAHSDHRGVDDHAASLDHHRQARRTLGRPARYPRAGQTRGRAGTLRKRPCADDDDQVRPNGDAVCVPRCVLTGP